MKRNALGRISEAKESGARMAGRYSRSVEDHEAATAYETQARGYRAKANAASGIASRQRGASAIGGMMGAEPKAQPTKSKNGDVVRGAAVLGVTAGAVAGITKLGDKADAAKAKGVSVAGAKVGTGLAVTMPLATAAVAAADAKKAGKSNADAATAAVKAGGKTAVGVFVATKLLSNAAHAVAAAAPKLAPALGPAGLAITAGVAAYGGVKGFKQTGTLKGAAVGAMTGGYVPQDMKKVAEPKASVQVPVSVPGGTKKTPSRSEPEARPQAAAKEGVQRTSYSTVDGRSIEGTPAQQAAWRARRREQAV